jgi:AraC-like DNA-binding protein
MKSSPALDLLNHVLQSLKVLDSSLGMFEFVPPWGLSMQSAPAGMVTWYAPMQGRCYLEVDGGLRAEIGVGDVALVLGRPLRYASAEGVPVVPFLSSWHDQQLPDMGPKVERRGPVRFTWPQGPRPAGAVVDRMMTVALLVEDVAQSPVLAVLPPLIVLRADEPETTAWLAPLARFVEDELRAPKAGYNAVARQQAGTTFIALLRQYVLHSGSDRASWMRGMADPMIGHALELLHAAPAEDWSLAKLAGACGLSRSNFAKRFHQLVGQPPMTYLASVRLHAAARLLVEGCRVAEAAERVGYRSEWAFRQAFTRQFGLAPLRYRQSRRAGPIGA